MPKSEIREAINTANQLKQFELCSKYYSYDQYRHNVTQFYLRKYTFC